MTDKPHTLADEIEAEAGRIIDAAWAMTREGLNLDGLSPTTSANARASFLVGIVTSNAFMRGVPPARHGALRHALVMVGQKKAHEWKEQHAIAPQDQKSLNGAVSHTRPWGGGCGL